MRQNPERRRAGVVLSALAAFIFFTFAWHGSVTRSWLGALGGGVFMGLVVLGSQWFLMRAGSRRSAHAGWRGK